MENRKPIIRHLDDMEPLDVPCGESRRLITRADTPHLGVHVTCITNGDLHYHNRSEEVYYILEGEGIIELDGELHTLTEGTVVWIPPGVKHRSWGDFKTMVITSPAFDPEDEVLV